MESRSCIAFLEYCTLYPAVAVRPHPSASPHTRTSLGRLGRTLAATRRSRAASRPPAPACPPLVGTGLRGPLRYRVQGTQAGHRPASSLDVDHRAPNQVKSNRVTSSPPARAHAATHAHARAATQRMFSKCGATDPPSNSVPSDGRRSQEMSE